MNKTALMNYALAARKELESQIALSLNKLGIYKDSIKKANIVGDYTIIEGTEETFPKRVYELRTPILSQVKEDGFDQVVEEFAYTWFNRIIALRFMEVHDYFDHGFRVLSSRDGSYEPEVLKNVSYVIDYLKLDKKVVTSLHDQGKNEELYRYILFKQCNVLSNSLPMLFNAQESYMELLLPNNLLSKGSVIRQIEDIPEEDFLNDVEVIGWLYQYYVASNREEFRKLKIVTKDKIPTLSQIFTPDWIVRYMAQNSIGRIWLESYPDSPLKSQMKYYVEDAKQEEEVQKKLDAIKYKNVNPEDLRIIEPCCGSGHILVYVFDLLLEMYKERGYNLKDIPGKILSKNLYGLDVDKRAAQLSQFSLMMKARSIDNRFFSDNRRVIPQVYEIQDSKLLISLNYKQNMIDFGFSKKTRDIVDYLVETFEDGKVIGSLLKVEPKDYQSVIDEVESIKDTYVANLLQMEFANYGLKRLVEICRIARILSSKYDVMVTNPPYLSSTKLEASIHDYVYSFYPCSKDDLFSMFMETEFVKSRGYLAIVNPDSWMFLESYKDLRNNLLSNKIIKNMIHIGMGAFDAVVQTTTLIVQNIVITSYIGSYYRLVESSNYENVPEIIKTKKDYYERKQTDFYQIKQAPIAYWPSSKTLTVFHDSQSFGEFGNTKKGILTGDDAKFGRFWFEVSSSKIGFGLKNHADMLKKNKKWITCTSGGAYRKWYGNFEWVVNLENNGYAIKHNEGHSNRLRDPSYYFKECVTWSEISSKAISIRYVPEGILFGNSGPCCFFDDHLKYFMGLLNTNVTYALLKVLSPTLTFGPEQLKRLPVVFEDVDKVEKLVNHNIDICKNEWDSYETSWEMKAHPLTKKGSLKENFDSLCDYRFQQFNILYANEIELNSIFIKNYGLQEEISPQFDKKLVTYRLANKEREIKSLISYFVGCIMGRYSLEHEGLIYAQEKGVGFNPSMYGDYVDEDGILPIYNFAFMEDGLTEKICQMIKRVYGEDTYKENMEFIASALEPDSNDSPEQILNRYLNNEFYSNHLKIYQKRPIYWMFSSGKHGAFKCLVYMHRYNKDTLARINTKYFLPRTAMYKSEHSRLEGLIETATDARQKKNYQKQLDEVIACEKELFEYGQVLDHMANQFIDIDLDDGVKVNYDKFQNGELIVDGATIKKPLLVPIK